jgi:hypothetical protein
MINPLYILLFTNFALNSPKVYIIYSDVYFVNYIYEYETQVYAGQSPPRKCVNMCRTHFNFLSGSIRLATPTILRRTLLPVNVLSELSIGSLLNRKTSTSHAWLSAPKLPQPRVDDLIDIAAAPAIRRCCIGTPHRETRILALTVDVRDCWSRVSCQKQWDKGDSALRLQPLLGFFYFL